MPQQGSPSGNPGNPINLASEPSSPATASPQMTSSAGTTPLNPSALAGNSVHSPGQPPQPQPRLNAQGQPVLVPASLAGATRPPGTPAGAAHGISKAAPSPQSGPQPAGTSPPARPGATTPGHTIMSPAGSAGATPAAGRIPQTPQTPQATGEQTQAAQPQQQQVTFFEDLEPLGPNEKEGKFHQLVKRFILSASTHSMASFEANLFFK